ncbi:MAG: hypothetical protein US63_C0006G0008 [Candidatus Moranbacteria bacterium GW2011_GWC2_37_8]|nr:MAG: hypothetical protein US63_C0006G0008 [Candidatus Moranbacteria bacterium GW2011_GWC2_37_8]KKQ62434.1 MAG: hypothetical protein US82_C0011G0008 [Parcubacteria group bacterium GW2011_GWC1_38_22]KKQ80292.1 MAG: hypothetical protein UT03_C0028G0008 [Candidatus Moranbacteria bacterium GW2011_GWD2_38_7]
MASITDLTQKQSKQSLWGFPQRLFFCDIIKSTLIIRKYKIMSRYDMPSANNIEQVKHMEKEPEEIIKEQRKNDIATLSKELAESGEKFSFSGIESDSYAKLKAEEDEFPGFVTPIDELIQQFKDEGMKIAVVSGKNAKAGNVFVLPFGSDDIKNDSIFPEKLQISENMDERLKELILLRRS